MRESLSFIDSGAVIADAGDATCLERHLGDTADDLRTRLSPRYDWFLEQCRTAIVMTMAARDIRSPFLAAVHLGACGELTALIGSDDDAFAVLIQAALQIWSGRSLPEVQA